MSNLNPISPELETALQALISQGRTVEAIKKLREATSAPLGECKEWVKNRTGSVLRRWNGRPCPYCQRPLRTTEARQCFECGKDWHELTDVISHAVQPHTEKTTAMTLEPAVANDDWPNLIVTITDVGQHRARVIALLREILNVSPAEAKELMNSPRIEVARGPRMEIESVVWRFKAAGAEVEAIVAPDAC